ncbi:MAG: EamA family transporter [Clostridia bacterium]|nr:EamA family transporter [Clostridia bacterium]
MKESMIGMLLIFAGLVCHQFEAILVKQHGKKHGSGGMHFNAIICLFAMVYFFVTDKNGLQFSREVILYGVANCFMYATGFYTTYLAFRSGSFGLTRLFTAFSGIIPIFYGIIFLKEPTYPITYVALVLIFVSVFLMNYTKGEKDGNKLTIGWLICTLLTVLSNAIISIIGKVEHDHLGDGFNNEFLIISLGGAAIILFILGFIFERKDFRSTFRYGLVYGMFAGIFNGINNLLVLTTYNYLPLSFISPVKTGLGIVISFFVSLLFFREKFSRRQIASVAIGIVAVVLINIKI